MGPLAGNSASLGQSGEWGRCSQSGPSPRAVPRSRVTQGLFGRSRSASDRAKEREGDGRTPEGVYRLDYRNPRSAFYKALHISYPTPSEVTSARARGVDPGGLVMVHGIQNGLGWLGRLHRVMDWTDGCIAVTDREMDEIWSAVPDGTRIELRP